MSQFYSDKDLKEHHDKIQFQRDCESLELNLCLLASIAVPSQFDFFIRATESKARQNGFTELRGRKYSEKVVLTVIEKLEPLMSEQ